MNVTVANWREDLEASRDVSAADQEHFGFLLGWFESWRLKGGLDPNRQAAVAFWRTQVTVKPRKSWQLERWEREEKI
jgi:hypothetical protein